MTHKRKISVIGLGYVGLPVAVAFGKNDEVIGFDISEARVEELKQGKDSTNEVTAGELASSKIKYTTDPENIRAADFHIVTVPTPVNAAKHPDLTPLLKASALVGSQIKKGDIVVFESTVYPGSTEEDCVPVMEKASGLACGSDFFVGYSPERINPGDKKYKFTTIQKVVSGQNDEILDIVADVYGSVVTAGIHRASSIKVAEAAKVIENTQRDLNIALMNELALIFEKMGIDTLDVLEAAGTKWNFLPFRPGLVGGHCIGVDPYYLTYKASLLGYTPQVILSGRSINDNMGTHIAGRIVKALNKAGLAAGDCLITILGLTFKEDIPDLRNSRVPDIINELASYGARIQVHDPHADARIARELYAVELMKYDHLKPAKVVVVAVSHQEYREAGWGGIAQLINGQGIVFDVKGILPRDDIPDGVDLFRM